MASSSPSVAIIGAGAAGITAAKSLLEQGFQVTIFEKDEDLGGQWNNSSSTSGVWDNMHANTSRKITSFSDFPIREDLPHFLHHKQMREYFQSYMDHFGVTNSLKLSHRVEQCVLDAATSSPSPSSSPTTSGDHQQQHQKKWRITVRNLKTDQVTTQLFDFLISATGRYSTPSRLTNLDYAPFLKKGGKVMPAQQYRSAINYANKKVLVVGGSFTAIDIALDLISAASTPVVVSCRTPYWVVGKRIGGKIYDEVFWKRATLAVPADKFVAGCVDVLKSLDANPGKHGGLPASEKLFLESSLAVGGGFHDALLEGKVKQRPEIQSINKDGSVTFKDGYTDNFDVIIEAIGFKVSLPYLPPELQAEIIDGDREYVKLFHWTFHPSIPSLAILGRYKSLAAYNPQLELQGRWVSYVWKGITPLPPAADMEKWIKDVLLPFEKSRYPSRPHHAIMEDFAQLANVIPVPENNAEEVRGLLTEGILVGALYRLDGPGAKKKEATELIIKWNKEFAAY